MSGMTDKEVEQFNKDSDNYMTSKVREMAKNFGFNSTFADDDLMIIGSLANKAIEAGLTDHLNEGISSRLKHIKDKL